MKKTEKDKNVLLTRKDTAQLLGVCLTTLDNWTREGKLTKHRKESSSTYYDNKRKFQALQKQGTSFDLPQKIQEKWTFLQAN